MKKIIKNILLSISIISSSNLGLIACSSEKENEILNYSNFYVLGDSLSDTGAGTFAQNQYLENSNNKFKHFQLDEPYYNNSWSNNKVASQLIAEKININFKPGWLFTLNDKIYQNYGNNYAFGGEVADSSNHNLVIKSFDLKNQTKALLSQHKLQKKDLIWVEIGANDISSLMNKTDPIIINNKINNVINEEIKAINLLIANGAKQIIISDVPDLTLTPKVKKILNNNQEKIKTASKICIKYQETWNQMIIKLKNIYKNIIIPFFLSKELETDMINFKNKIPNGIIETSATYSKMITKKEIYSYKPIFNSGVNASNLNKYFYFDEFHPGMWFHQQMANHIIDILQNN
ncbi:SGNH/GDSL hydrolase family protein [Spiroplasma endosymbiont of Nebria brevicollis]|uniref:SGNH/GDSL hydrolase family protein n=1 Tax=Spiroplasma endosymbiont of Nebria brevicollis TaxID=3066284 RepID=UPI00313CE456